MIWRLDWEVVLVSCTALESAKRTFNSSFPNKCQPVFHRLTNWDKLVIQLSGSRSSYHSVIWTKAHFHLESTLAASCIWSLLAFSTESELLTQTLLGCYFLSLCCAKDFIKLASSCQKDVCALWLRALANLWNCISLTSSSQLQSAVK